MLGTSGELLKLADQESARKTKDAFKESCPAAIADSASYPRAPYCTPYSVKRA